MLYQLGVDNSLQDVSSEMRTPPNFGSPSSSRPTISRAEPTIKDLCQSMIRCQFTVVYFGSFGLLKHFFEFLQRIEADSLDKNNIFCEILNENMS